jgi:hypothetical protein
MYTPAYFQSEWTGMEFSLLQARAALLPAEQQALSSGILPVLWVRGLEPLPAAAAAIPYTDPRLPVNYEQRGLRYLMRTRDERQYRTVLARIAERVVELGTRAPLPLGELPALEALSNPFAVEGSDAKRVLVIYAPIAIGSMPDVPDPGRRRPFYQQPLRDLVRQVLVQENLFYEETSDLDLVTRVKAAYRSNQLVAIFVTLERLAEASYLRYLSELFEHRLPNCIVCVLADAGAHDPRLVAQLTRGRHAYGSEESVLMPTSDGELQAMLARELSARRLLLLRERRAER